MAMNLDEVLTKLESLGSDKVCQQRKKNGAGEQQFGVKLGDIRKLAAKIKVDLPLANALWDSGNVDARLLAVLLIDPSQLAMHDVDRMVRSVDFVQVADWLTAYVVKKHPDKESLRQQWMQDNDPWAARAGWELTAERIAKQPDGIDPAELLDRLETEMAPAATEVQWTMNVCLAAIGIHNPQHRDRAIAIGEKLGIYRDYPVSKGCTSPFAPVWINEMVRRQG